MAGRMRDNNRGILLWDSFWFQLRFEGKCQVTGKGWKCFRQKEQNMEEEKSLLCGKFGMRAQHTVCLGGVYQGFLEK